MIPASTSPPRRMVRWRLKLLNNSERSYVSDDYLTTYAVQSRPSRNYFTASGALGYPAGRDRPSRAFALVYQYVQKRATNQEKCPDLCFYVVHPPSIARYAGYDAEQVRQGRAGEAAGRLAVVELQQFCFG